MSKYGTIKENLELETLGRIYIRTRDRKYEIDYTAINKLINLSSQLSQVLSKINGKNVSVLDGLQELQESKEMIEVSLKRRGIDTSNKSLKELTELLINETTSN